MLVTGLGERGLQRIDPLLRELTTFGGHLGRDDELAIELHRLLRPTQPLETNRHVEQTRSCRQQGLSRALLGECLGIVACGKELFSSSIVGRHLGDHLVRLRMSELRQEHGETNEGRDSDSTHH